MIKLFYMLNEVLKALIWGLALSIWILIFAGLSPAHVVGAGADKIAAIIDSTTTTTN